jgi:hypothetical protein
MSTYSSYSDYRMAYHLDGTVLVRGATTGTPKTPSTLTDTVTSGGALTSLNDQNIGGTYWNSNQTDGWIGMVFPQLRDITGMFLNCYDSSTKRVQYSTDTTNGLDGTWSTLVAARNWSLDTNYRTNIYSVSQTGVKGLRIPDLGSGGSRNDYVGSWHVFGKLASGQTPSRLDLWHPTSNARVSSSHFDLGDKPRSTTTDISFRVKNQSSTLTSNSIVVSVETLTDLAPTAIGNYTINLNGGSFASSQTITSLAPNAISNILTLRFTNPSDAALSLWAGTVKALATSWT